MQTRILAPPLIGELRLGPPGGLVRLLPAVLVATLMVVGLPRLARAARWPTLLLVAPLAAAGWAVALAIAWGVSAADAVMVDRDRQYPRLADLGAVF